MGSLLLTAVIWDPVLSVLLSPGGSGEPTVAPGPEAMRAAAAAHNRRLSASFFSLEMPGEEQELREVPGPPGVLKSAEPVVGSVVVAGVLGLLLGTLVPSSSHVALDVLESSGAVVLRNESLLTEMKALPGVAKGRGRWGGWEAPPAPGTFPSFPASSSVDGIDLLSLLRAGLGSAAKEWLREGPVWEKVAWGVQGERQRDGSVPPGPVLTVVGLSRGGGVKVAPRRPSWLSSEPSSVSSSEESTSWMASCFCRDSRRSARSCLMADSLSFSLLFPAPRPSEPRAPSPSCRPNFLEEEECLWRLPVSTPRPAGSSASPAASWGRRTQQSDS